MRYSSYVLVLAALWSCSHDQSVSFDPRVSMLRESVLPPARYTVSYLPTLGGSRNRAAGISNSGLVAGFVNRPGNATRVAALWRAGSLDTLGTLGGPNSIAQWPGISNNGIIAGITELAALDPLHEEWSCTAFLHDPTCNPPQVLQFRAVLWDTRRGTKQQLRPLPGDSTSAATGINDKGQVVGISGDCDIAVGQLSARHSVIWENGVPTNIGDLGGDAWHTPMDIDNAGDVVGFSNPRGVVGIDFNPHAFLWTKAGGIRDLRTLPGDDNSQALGVNSSLQVVGVSSGATNRAFLWENGVMQDLNTLVGPNFPDQLIVAQHINEDGVIVGRAVLHGTSVQVPFVATPVSQQ